MEEQVTRGKNIVVDKGHACFYTFRLKRYQAIDGLKVSATTKGAFLVKDDRVLKGPLGRSLRSFARTAHSAHSLRSAPLR